MTKFRAGIIIGFASGYYLGAKAGRERYDQLRRMGASIRRKNSTIDQAATVVGRAKAVVDLGRERVHDAVEPSGPMGEVTPIAR